MKTITIEFEFDEKKLGKEWFNIHNLELMLYSLAHTKRKLLKCELITTYHSLKKEK